MRNKFNQRVVKSDSSKKNNSLSSRRWMHEHINDKYVKEANKRGLRSRAVFKLEEINAQDKVIRCGMTIVDLGAAPGSWSQLAVDTVGCHGKVIACDILAMDPIAGVDFLQGDFREDPVLMALLKRINGNNVDVLLSDMAPNISGNAAMDQPKSMHLAALALDMCRIVLIKGGGFVVKVFMGADFDAFMVEVKTLFKVVKIRKPNSSRSRSRELFIVATEFKGQLM